MGLSPERPSQPDRAKAQDGQARRSRFSWIGPSFPHVNSGKALRRERVHLAVRREQHQQHFLLARLRMLTRRGEVWLVLLAIVVGALAGLAVVALRLAAEWMHVVLYQLRPQDRLSGLTSLHPFPGALVPLAGGIVLGALTLILRRGRNRPMVDPVEANALHGGRMSLSDSLIILVQTLVSNGFGASVGLEAAYTQIGSGMASKIGDRFRLRRRDMRMLVGCGAAAAIAAAFGAPLTGAFYGFELIIGTYTISALAPVICASIVAVLVSQAVGSAQTGIFVHVSQVMDLGQIAVLLLLGLFCGVLGIIIMYLVTLVGTGFTRARIPAFARPAIGGLVLGALALISPKILSSGHAAVQELFALTVLSMKTAVLLLGLKIVASSVSIGAGFRGGLFFASLFLGALAGQVFYGATEHFSPHLIEPAVAMLVGMAGLAAAVVGGPLTMSFLALEISGSLPITITVLLSAVTSSLLVRETFGYSFTTWRFHLRGETIRSAHDIGWMRNLTVGRMMRKDIPTVPADMSIREFRRQFPLGSTLRVVAVENDDQYAGIVLVPELYSGSDREAEGTIRPFLAHRNIVLTPDMQAKKAAVLFDLSQSEALAVVMAPDNWSVIGLLSEAHVLRRYAEELEKARKELAGERG